MTSSIISALLPIVVTLLFGFVAGWHHDFDGRQAGILDRMIMLYGLPLNLFAGMIGTPRDHIIGQGSLAIAILLSMAGTYAIVLVIARLIFKRDLMTSALQARAIGGPAVPFVGVPVLGKLFGTAESAIPISVASLVMNLIQVPVTLMLLSAGMGSKQGAAGKGAPTLTSHIVRALREPVVWAPILALVLVLFGLRFPTSIQDSFFLLGRPRAALPCLPPALSCSRAVSRSPYCPGRGNYTMRIVRFEVDGNSDPPHSSSESGGFLSAAYFCRDLGHPSAQCPSDC